MNHREVSESQKNEHKPQPEEPRSVGFGFPKEAPPEIGEKWEKGCVDFKLIGKAIGESGRMVESGRAALSKGFCGPIFRIGTSSGPVVEKTFIIGRKRTDRDAELGVRVRVDAPSQETISAVKPRLVMLDPKTREQVQIIDWVYNEETALTDLAGIPGIPNYVTSVYDGMKGSVVEGFIDGYELSAICENARTKSEIEKIFERLKTAYTAAAERGYLYNNVIGSTVLVERTSDQPYLVDWYSHGVVDVHDAASPAQKRFAQGLRDIEQCQNEMLERFSEEHAVAGSEQESS